MLKIQFQFAGFVEPDGRYLICITPIDFKNVSEECEKIIARYPTNPSFHYNVTCPGDNEHSEECQIMMEEWGQPCIKDQVEKAERRLKRLRFRPQLKECARNPASANGLYTLEDLAQEGCIYDVKYV